MIPTGHVVTSLNP